MALQVGDIAPDFKLPSTTGDKAGDFHLSSFRGKKNVVLAFYPLDFTPVCSLEMPAFEKSLERFSSSNAEVVGISTDSIACHAYVPEWMYIGPLSVQLNRSVETAVPIAP